MKKIIYLILGLAAFFMLGAYTQLTFPTERESVTLLQWFITGFFGLWFIGLALYDKE